MVGSIKWLLQHKNFSVRYESMEYLQFLGGDFTPHGLEMQENTDVKYTHRNTAGIGGDTN